MNTRVLLFCAWSGVMFVVLYVIGFVGFAGFIPPPEPSLSLDELGSLYSENRTGIRVGMIVCLIASTFLFPFLALVSLQIARIEGRSPALALMQFGAAVLFVVFFVLCSILWLTATFRPELALATVRVLHDMGWLIFMLVYPGYCMQMACIALASFKDRSREPVWPRWSGYFQLWVAFSGAGGSLAVFFKTGPFAWNGVIAFYVPVAVFVIWISLTTCFLHTAVRRQAADEAAAPPTTFGAAVGSPDLVRG